jgi:hypothetical protein
MCAFRRGQLGCDHTLRVGETREATRHIVGLDADGIVTLGDDTRDRGGIFGPDCVA